ncbi:helicase HerA-like domain-containing protein [Kitasatospora sp. NPDC005856]|uniref:type IV secretory system conjugative DNA transfer family protein n=1 Tax=Kitasatospora sp. NPDC005856 TaxID=3154566 RepID=UPI0033C2BC44
MPPDFLLGKDPTGRPVYLPDAIREEHVTIIGATGTGKTTLLQRLILDDVQAGVSCIVIDAHGDITRNVLARVPPSALDRMYLLEVWEDRPFGLNLLEVPDRSQRTIDLIAPEVVLVLKRMFEGETLYPQLDHDLQLLVHTLLANEGCTLAEVLLLLGEDREMRARLTRRLKSQAFIDSWRDYEALSTRERLARNGPLRNRFNSFLGSETMRSIIGQSQTTVPLKEFLDTPGQVLFISLPVGGSGSERESRFLGGLFVCLLARLVLNRAEMLQKQQIPNRAHLYLDEYGRYATPTTALFFGETRKYNFGLTVAHQSRFDVKNTGNENAELQAATLICFSPTSGDDARELADAMHVTPRPAKEPPRAIAMNPVQQLLEGKHESRAIQDLARKVFASCQDATVVDSYAFRKQEGAQLISKLLIDVMKHDVSLQSSEFFSRAADIAYAFRDALNLPWAASVWISEPWNEWLQELFRRIASGDPRPLNDPSSLLRIQDEYRADIGKIGNALDIHLSKLTAYREMGEAGYAFFKDFYELCQLLSEQPLYTAIPGHGGQPTQSITDAQAELANNIKGLLPRHAYVRLRTHREVQVSHVELLAIEEEEQERRERAIRISEKLGGADPEYFARQGAGDWAPGPEHYQKQQEFQDAILGLIRSTQAPTSESILQRVRERSRERFGTPRDEVEAQIRQRQERLVRSRSQRPASPSPEAEASQEQATAEKPSDQTVQEPPPIGRRSPKRK